MKMNEGSSTIRAGEEINLFFTFAQLRLARLAKDEVKEDFFFSTFAFATRKLGDEGKLRAMKINLHLSPSPLQRLGKGGKLHRR
jgi:hypothetical protein